MSLALFVLMFAAIQVQAETKPQSAESTRQKSEAHYASSSSTKKERRKGGG